MRRAPAAEHQLRARHQVTSALYRAVARCSTLGTNRVLRSVTFYFLGFVCFFLFHLLWLFLFIYLFSCLLLLFIFFFFKSQLFFENEFFSNVGQEMRVRWGILGRFFRLNLQSRTFFFFLFWKLDRILALLWQMTVSFDVGILARFSDDSFKVLQLFLLQSSFEILFQMFSSQVSKDWLSVAFFFFLSYLTIHLKKIQLKKHGRSISSQDDFPQLSSTSLWQYLCTEFQVII